VASPRNIFLSLYLSDKFGARFHHRNRNNSGPKLLAACLAKSTEFAFCCLSWRRKNRVIGWHCWVRTCRAPARRDRGGWRGTARLRDHAAITRGLQRIAESLKLTGIYH
jgi:hypothetical protein